jgi:hypothetical protein
VDIDEIGINHVLKHENRRAVRGKKIKYIRCVKKAKHTNGIAALCNSEPFAVKCYNHPYLFPFCQHVLQEPILLVSFLHLFFREWFYIKKSSCE